MKKKLCSLIIMLLLSFAFVITGCSNKGLSPNPSTDANVISNGGMTVVKEDYIQARLDAGVQIINVSAAAKTPELVAKIRSEYPDIPIMATGGPTDETIKATIEAGADAITWTPPTNGEVFRDIMEAYRKGEPHP